MSRKLSERKSCFFILLVVVCCTVLEAQNATDTDNICVCMKYYQCHENGTVKTGGEGLQHVKQGLVSRRFGAACSDRLERCCYIPPELRHLLTPEEMSPAVTTEDDIFSVDTSPSHSGCGVRKNFTTPSPLSNGVANNATQFAEYPWTVMLMEKPEGAGSFQLKCGGSLIHPEFVLTAAHCVHGVDQSTLMVRGGVWDLRNENEPLPHQDRSIKVITKHPKYNPSNLQNDIALLRVATPFNLADNIETVCISGFLSTYEDKKCIAVGWGVDSFDKNKTQDLLRKVNLKVISKASCETKLRRTQLGRFFLLHESFLCAQGEDGQDTCQRDGGGPIACPHPTLGENFWVQVGIVSWGVGCTSNHPALYTNLQIFNEWIVSQLPPSNTPDDF